MSIAFIVVCLLLYCLDDNAVDSRIDKKKRVIRKLVQLELSEKVAKAAVQCVPSLDVDECYLWALENGNEESIIAEQQKSFDEEVGKYC